MTAQNENEIPVLVVDDHPSIRAGLRAMIEKTLDMYVAGEAENGDDARRLLDELRPNIVLLDLDARFLCHCIRKMDARELPGNNYAGIDRPSS